MRTTLLASPEEIALLRRRGGPRGLRVCGFVLHGPGGGRGFFGSVYVHCVSLLGRGGVWELTMVDVLDIPVKKTC